MSKVIEFLGWFSGLVTIAAAGVGMVWFFFGLDSRVSTLEGQMQAIYQSASSSSQVTANNASRDGGDASSGASTNNQLQTLIETCSELALRVARAYENTNPLTVAAPLEKMMDKLGCHKIVPQ